MLINRGNLAELHEAAVRYVFSVGTSRGTEDGEETIETDCLTLVCEHPMQEPRLSKRSSLKRGFCDMYAGCLMNGYSSSQFAYDYHSRLFQYTDGVVSIDQVESAIHRIRKNPNTRRAQCITWQPKIDTKSDDVPCLQLINFRVVEGKLNMYVTFRSNDILSAFGANAYALTLLQKHVADELHMAVGRYTHIAIIPHIYPRRDADELRRFIDGVK